jgi:DNA (cytosine-5)-methyltransferase 1
MPPPTHGPSPNLLPFVSVNDTISRIPFNAPDHDLEGVAFAPHRFERPWDGNRILPRTMTTHGGNYHPSGERGFTVREYAALQGFPLEHVFEGSGRKRQIGNAVPPCVARVLFESVRRDLDRVDGVVGEEPVVIED